MKYERITMREFAGVTGDKSYNRLAEIEDKIESGEIVERTSEEYSAVRKQVVKDCLQFLRNIRLGYTYDDYSMGWDDAVDAAVKEFTEKYDVSMEEVFEK